MSSHEDLFEEANEAINKVFGDTNVSQEEIKESLEELRANISTMLDTLE